MKVNNNNYKSYLENEQLDTYPNNRNLRVKSEFVKSGEQKGK